MIREEKLLVILAEEASEVVQEISLLSQQISKCLRFGPNQVYQKIGLSNAQRVVNCIPKLMLELNDFKALVEMLQSEGTLPSFEGSMDWDPDMIEAKKNKVESYLKEDEAVWQL